MRANVFRHLKLFPAGFQVYNDEMPDARCEEMKRYVGFDDRDASNLRALAAVAKPVIPAIVDHFYSQLELDEGAMVLLSDGVNRVENLRRTLETWLKELFDDPYNSDYYRKRRRIGQRHVQVGLPQHYMFLGMQLVWQEFERQIYALDPPNVREKLSSLHKLLMFDLAVMMESYKDSYSEKIRTVERSSMEEKLTRAEHLATIGQLAASLAHEIKNPLAGISGAIQIIRDEYPKEDPHQPILTEVLGQIGRLDATVKDLLQYARPTPPRVMKFSVDAVVRRVLIVLQEEPAFQSVKVEYAKPLAETMVSADDRQIEQLLMNLLLNAAHASVEGGVVRLSIVPNHGHVKLVVQDFGEGMSPEKCEKAFEAFYTTKARGTGLGLSICRRIAEAHGGDIQITSELGVGTTVTVTLPSTT